MTAELILTAAVAGAFGGAVALVVHEYLAYAARRDRSLIELRLLAKGAHPKWARHDAITATRGRRLSVFAGRGAA